MIKLLADENFNNNIIRGLQRIKSNIDIMRVQDIGLAGSHDIEILEWAAKNKRVLLTHDVTTITKYAY
jgi:predicted nuclease of predicted toxin-antitoxin system